MLVSHAAQTIVGTHAVAYNRRPKSHTSLNFLY